MIIIVRPCTACIEKDNQKVWNWQLRKMVIITRKSHIEKKVVESILHCLNIKLVLLILELITLKLAIINITIAFPIRDTAIRTLKAAQTNASTVFEFWNGKSTHNIPLTFPLLLQISVITELSFKSKPVEIFIISTLKLTFNYSQQYIRKKCWACRIFSN